MNIDLLNAWGAAMWRASWQGALAALGAWCICGLFPSIPARFQSWLWRLVLLKFLIALFWLSPVQVPLLPSVKPAHTESASQPIAGPTPIETAVVVSGQSTRSITPWSIPFVGWAVVVGWQASRLLRSCGDARRLRCNCRPAVDADLLDRLKALSTSAGLFTTPTLLEADGQGSPMLIGIRRPAIVMPVVTLRQLDESERAMVIGHELAHVRRGDLFWGFLAAIVRTIFFFHPLAWLSERQLRLTQEIAADEFAIGLQKQDPLNYATLLMSVVSKLGRDRSLATVSVAMAGSHHSLTQRFSAMRFFKPVSRRIVIFYAVVLGMAAVLGGIPWTLVAAESPAQTADKIGAKGAPAADKVEPKAADKVEPKVGPAETQKDKKQLKSGAGRFVSFKDGVLTVKGNAGILVWNEIPANATTLEFPADGTDYKPVDTVEALNRVKAGAFISVRFSKNQVLIHIGSRKSQTIGTFVSFKQDRLLMLGKNLGERFTKKYGNNVHFNRFADDIPAYESIDGGDYKLIGTANKVLGEVKEGTIITVHAEGDDNITLVQIGVPAKK